MDMYKTVQGLWNLCNRFQIKCFYLCMCYVGMFTYQYTLTSDIPIYNKYVIHCLNLVRIKVFSINMITYVPYVLHRLFSDKLSIIG